MALRWYSVVVDASDIAMLARWWAETLDWQLIYEDEDEAAIVPRDVDGGIIDDPDLWRRQGPGMVFVLVPEAKTVKNRLHIDLAPHISDDREASIQRLVDRGATRVDVGQREDVTWTVLADPEGNEFCVLSSRDR
ncbi:VOC family protein [Janibacter sp. GXQ6167]|uniref:VOC family protein n=1 Tax=Janibacter sp. GXQ6167 TaxID=3240791 RepID=UPI0035251F99